MAVKFTNNAATTLTSAVSISDTTIAVASNTGFPSISGSDYFYVSIDSEVLKVTSVSGTTFTVDAATAAHSSGNGVELRVSAEVLNDVRTETTNRSISDSTSTTSSTTSASSTAVKAAYDIGNHSHSAYATTGYADTAEADAITTAASDATTKADAAEAAAISTASADATTKADAAQAAAEATAATANAALTHDGLTGFVANEHLDWTTDRGATNIHAGNYTDTNTTYSAGTGMSLSGTQFNCTVTDTNTTYSGGTGLTLSGTTFNLDGATQTARGGAKMHVSGGILYIVTT